MNKYRPEYEKPSFTCPYCHAYSLHIWSAYNPTNNHNNGNNIVSVDAATCINCSNSSLWVNKEMIIPSASIIPQPSENMPQDIKEIYNEAAGIFSKSPRSAAALLRLALEMLVNHCGYNAPKLNMAIRKMAEDNIPPIIQKSADILRVVGNHTLHPGLIDVNDSPEIAVDLFVLLNILVRYMIDEPMYVNDLYEQLPERDLKSISNRDKNN